MKKICVLIVTTAIILTACSSGGNSGEDLISSQGSSFDNSNDVQLADGVYITYDKTPFLNATAKCYYAKHNVISEETVFKLYSTRPEITREGDEYTSYKTETESGSFSQNEISGCSIYYRTEQGNDFDTAAYTNYSDYSADLEFDFKSREDVDLLLSETLSAFVPSGLETHIYSVTSSDYSNYVSEYPTFFESFGELKQEAASQRKWAEPDDYYFINAFQSVDGIPIFGEVVGNPDNGTLTHGTSIHAVCTRNGLEYLVILSPYQIEEEVPIDNAFISVDEAENILKNKYNSLLSLSEVTFTSVRLVYIPLNSASGRLILTPAWEFTDSQNVPTYINAYTGEEII